MLGTIVHGCEHGTHSIIGEAKFRKSVVAKRILVNNRARDLEPISFPIDNRIQVGLREFLFCRNYSSGREFGCWIEDHSAPIGAFEICLVSRRWVRPESKITPDLHLIGRCLTRISESYHSSLQTAGNNA